LFYEAIEKRLAGSDQQAYLAEFNISRILTLRRIYLWDKNTNPLIYLGSSKETTRNGKLAGEFATAPCFLLGNF
jgi:hypothetical protein